MYPLEGRRSTIRLMLGDCIERMKEIDDGSVDLTVTSPPYDNLRTYNGNNALWGEHAWKSVLADLFRVTKPGGVVVWVVGDATIKGSETGTSFRQALYAMECGFNLHDTIFLLQKSCARTREARPKPTPPRGCPCVFLWRTMTWRCQCELFNRS